MKKVVQFSKIARRFVKSGSQKFPLSRSMSQFDAIKGWQPPLIRAKDTAEIRRLLTLNSSGGKCHPTFTHGVPPAPIALADHLSIPNVRVPSFVPLAMREAFVAERMKRMPELLENFKKVSES